MFKSLEVGYQSLPYKTRMYTKVVAWGGGGALGAPAPPSQEKKTCIYNVLDFNINFDPFFSFDNTVCKMLKPQTPRLLVVQPLSENRATALVYSIRPITCYLS